MKTRVRWNRHTLALLAIVGGMWYAAEAQSNGAAHLIALLAASMGALSWLHARANLRGLNVRLVGARPAAQDASKRIPVELRATGAVSPCGLEVLVLGAEKPVFVECVPAGGSVMADLPPPLHATGGALRILVRSVYPLGLFSVEKVLETSWVRRVHPQPVGDLPLPTTTHSAQGDSAPVSSQHATQSSGGDDFTGLREWRAGDSPRHIDWRAAARGGPLMVKMWSAGAHGVVVLDWKSLVLDDNARASQIARWMEICEAEGRPYEVRLPETTFRAGLGPAHHRRCLDAIATQPDTEPGAFLANDLKAASGSSAVSFERSSYLPARPLLFLCLALLLTLWPLHGFIATSSLFICGACLVWRGLLRQAVPHIILRLLVIIIGFAAVWFENDGLYGMETGIALLLVLAGAKMLESRTPREFQVLALIGWFLAFCAILLESHLSRSIGTVALLLLIAACMVRFRRSAAGGREPARVSATLFAQALPLAVALFFVFPRGLLDLNAALGRNRISQTGIDSTLDPGSLARVALNTDVAFRARFPDSEPPPNDMRYWRCLTLWQCNGLRWTRGDWLRHGGALGFPKTGQNVRQIIDIEPHGRHWLPALDRPLLVRNGGSRQMPEYDDTFVSAQPVLTATRIEVTSHLENLTDRPPPRDLAESHREAALQLPEKISPRLKQLTDSWEAAAQTDEQIAQLAIQYIQTQGFTYTLEPGEYIADDPLEEFYLRRRTGFCEHFAASFATLMRMAGIPSRLVIGYLGGEYSDHNGGYLIIKQSDVHAWTEVWLERYGWVRVDPTAALAPDRINVDLRSYLAGGAEEAERQRRTLWGRMTQRARLLWDSVSYAWQRQVIDYSQESQRSLLERFGLRQSRLLLLILSVAALLIVIAILTWWLRRPARHSDPWMRAWQRLSRKLAKAGITPRHLNEGPLAFASRVATTRPDLAPALQPLAEMYAAGRYGPTSPALADFKQRVRAFRGTLARRHATS